MKSKYKIIIFDLIDTLADSQSISRATKKLEHAIGPDMINTLIDHGKIDIEKTADETINRIKNTYKIDTTQEHLIRTWMEPDGTVLLPGTIEILTYLKNKGYMIGVISNSPPTTQNQLKDLGIDSLVNEALFSFECGYRKPDKEIYHHFLDKINILPEDALMIGDSLKNDVLGAKAAGIDAILLDPQNIHDVTPKISNLLDLKNIL